MFPRIFVFVCGYTTYSLVNIKFFLCVESLINIKFFPNIGLFRGHKWIPVEILVHICAHCTVYHIFWQICNIRSKCPRNTLFNPHYAWCYRYRIPFNFLIGSWQANALDKSEKEIKMVKCDVYCRTLDLVVSSTSGGGCNDWQARLANLHEWVRVILDALFLRPCATSEQNA